MERFDTLFSLRYAERVLERHARLWSRIDKAVRFFSLLSGSASFAALMSQNKTLSLTLGIFFAIFQAIEFSLSPAEQAAKAKAGGKLYSDILSRQATLNDAELEAVYQQADDDLVATESIRLIAYNDVSNEKGCDPQYLYSLTNWQRLIAFIS